MKVGICSFSYSCDKKGPVTVFSIKCTDIFCVVLSYFDVFIQLLKLCDKIRLNMLKYKKADNTNCLLSYSPLISNKCILSK